MQSAAEARDILNMVESSRRDAGNQREKINEYHGASMICKIHEPDMVGTRKPSPCN